MARARVTEPVAVKPPLARPWLARIAILIVGIGLFVGGVVWIGDFTRDQVRDSDRYRFPFADIDCTVPPEQDRKDFLAEVQYLAGTSDDIALLEPDLPRRLADAFARHPWVARVVSVTIRPPRDVRVQLTFREPVLQIRSRNLDTPASAGWVLDANGYLLPRTTHAPELAVYRSERTPLVPIGCRWAAAEIVDVLRVTAYLRPYQDQFHIGEIERGPEGLALVTNGGTRIQWGRPPGQEDALEASAAKKVEQLLNYCAHHGSLDQPAGIKEHDVRQ